MPYTSAYVHPDHFRGNGGINEVYAPDQSCSRVRLAGENANIDKGLPNLPPFIVPNLSPWVARAFNYKAYNVCRPVDPATLPPRVRLGRVERCAPLDHYSGPCGTEVIVSDAFRAIVERFEPGVHQFVPVEIQEKGKGGGVRTNYFYLICQQYTFSIIPERSPAYKLYSEGETEHGGKRLTYRLDVPHPMGRKRSFEPDHYRDLKPVITHKAAAIAGRKLWREVKVLDEEDWAQPVVEEFDERYFTYSDDLFEALMAAGMRGIAAKAKGVLNIDDGGVAR